MEGKVMEQIRAKRKKWDHGNVIPGKADTMVPKEMAKASKVP